jgi:DNA-binding transcriptional MerR regulator
MTILEKQVNTPIGAEQASDHPLYNIGVVTRMTGISIATLRAWERRYGFPQSGRTGGGHRLYSERDVIRLRWVKGQIDQGMQTAQAIHALEFQERSGRLPDLVEKAGPAAEPSNLDSYRARLLDALIRHDTDRADQLLGELLPLIHPEGLILDIIGPTLVAIGDAWAAQQISVATEHLATHYLRQRLLMWMISGPPSYATRPVILACAPNELHEGGLLMLGALLRRRRWPVAYLGQTVPLPDLAELVRDLKPPIIVLVAMGEEQASALTEWPMWLPEVAQAGKPIIAYAGRIFSEHPEWRMRVPGIFLGASMREGMETIEKLLSAAPR